MYQSDVDDNNIIYRTADHSSTMWHYPESPCIDMSWKRTISSSNGKANRPMSMNCLPIFLHGTEGSVAFAVSPTLAGPYANQGCSSRRDNDKETVSANDIVCLSTVDTQCTKNVIESNEVRPRYRNLVLRTNNDVVQRANISCIDTLTPVVSRSTAIRRKPARLVLNIGGVVFETLETTLATHPNTLLGDPDRRTKYLNNHTGEFVFHRRFASFDAILFFYQSNGILAKPQNVDQVTFERELDFFEIPIKKPRCTPHKQYELLRPKRSWPHSRSTVRVLRRLFHSPFSSPSASLVAILNILVTTLLTVEFCVSTLPKYRQLRPNDPVSVLQHGEQFKSLAAIEIVCMLFLNMDFVIRLLLSQQRVKYLVSHLSIIDMITMLTFHTSLLLDHLSSGSRERGYSNFLRQVRILQVFRLARYSYGFRSLLQTISRSMLHLGSFILIVPIMSMCFATMMFFFEEDTYVQNAHCSNNCRTFGSLSDWFWYSIITITTVGYGDVYPRTIFGKMIGTVCALFGVVLFCLLTPIIFRQFVEQYYIPRLNSKAIDAEERKLAENVRDVYYEDRIELNG